MMEALARLFAGPAPEPGEPQVYQLPMVETAASTSTLAAFMEAAPDGIVMVDRSGTIAVANLQMHRMLGYDDGALVGQSIEVLVPTRMRDQHVARREGYQNAPHVRRMGTRLALTALRADGTELAVDIALGSIALNGSEVTLAFVRDATEQQRLWDELAAAKGRLEAELVERRQYRALTELLQTLRSRDEIRSVLSLHMERLFPQTTGSLALLDSSQGHVDVIVAWGIGATADPVTVEACTALRLGRSHESGPQCQSAACDHACYRHADALCLPLMADGETLGLFHVQAERIDPDPASGLSADERRRAADVAERLALPLANIQLRDRLLNQSVRDPLTGVYNRRYLDESVAKELSRAARLEYGLSLALVDLDHFKTVNDSLGHDAGDKLLRTFAQFMASHIRVDDSVFRYGGEEFVLLLPGASAESARSRLETLAQQWRTHAGTHGWTATFSAGVAAYPLHGASPHDLLRAADVALYGAKAAGRNRVLSPDDLARRT